MITNKLYDIKFIIRKAKALNKDDLKIVIEKLQNYLNELDGLIDIDKNLEKIKEMLSKNLTSRPKNKNKFLSWLKEIFLNSNYSKADFELLFEKCIEKNILSIDENDKIEYLFNSILEKPQIIYENILKKMPITQRPKKINNLVEFIYQSLNQFQSKTDIKKMLYTSKLLTISQDGDVFYFIKK